MLKRIYIFLFAGTLFTIQSATAAPQAATNIKKIIQKKDEIIVIIHENGKDRQLTLTREALKRLTAKAKKDNKNEAVVKKRSSSIKKEIAKKESPKKIEETKKSTQAKKEEKTSTKTVKNELIKKAKKETKVAKQAKPSQKTIATKTPIKKESKQQDTQQNVVKLKKNEYRVVRGDTLFSIARKHKVLLADLVKINKMESTTLIHPGDIIKIPGINFIEGAKKEVAQNNKTVYKVNKGDTIYSIAKKYNMDIKTLKKLNELTLRSKLKPGMELTVIGKPKAAKKTKIAKKTKKATKHIVKRGETIWTIARKYNLTIKQLRLLNPKIRTHSLKVGSVLNVSKKRAIKLAKSKRYRSKRSRLSGVLARYKRRSYGTNRDVVAYAKRFLGTRYVWGASRPGAFDCSGFTQYVMKHAKGRNIPRVSRRQAYYGRYVSRRNLRAGDLVFFDTSRRRRGYVNHVGIYIGNGKFIHASSGKHRVVITSLNKPFYRQRFMWGRRIY